MLAGLVLALPAQAQVAPQAAMAGVWTGTVGTLPVHACLRWRDWRGDGELSGAYYYDRHLAPIRLAGDGDGLAEQPRFMEPSGDRWTIERVDARGMTGTWRGHGRSLPIRLSRAEPAAADGERDEPCGSPAFFAPRLAGSSWTEARGVQNGQGYTLRTYVPPPLFRNNEEGIALLAFTLLRLDEVRPGDATINAGFADAASDAAITECFAMSLSEFGADGGLTEIHTLDALTPRWLGISISSSYYCGGAHPDSGYFHRIYDRVNGAVIMPGDWLGPLAVTREKFGSDGQGSYADTLTDRFRTFLLAHWPQAADLDAAECAEVVGGERMWDMGLIDTGLKFTPQLPHVVQACGNTVEVGWADLEPYLSAEGQAVRAGL